MPIRSQNSTIRAVLARFALLHLIPLSCLFPLPTLSAVPHDFVFLISLSLTMQDGAMHT